ncbi:NfeD family protein [Pseudomonas sp. Marseille-QA0892]
MDVQWWYWLVLGGVLVAAELVVPAFFVFWFGLAAGLVSLTVLLMPGLSFPTQLLIWAAASVLMVIAWFRYFRRESPKAERWTAQEYVGEQGVLLSPVPEFGKGRVRFSRSILGNQEWTCTSDHALDQGARVALLEIHGNVAKVTQAQ